MKKNCTHNRIKNHTGFTLMEVMVAVSIFTIIVTVGIVALLTINNTYKQSQIQRQTVDSIGFILENMSRSLRTARSWDAITQNAIVFTDQDGVTISYDFFTGPTGGLIEKNESGTPIRLTPENLDIQEVIFESSGGQGTGVQQYLQIQIRGMMKTGRQESPFAVQTGISKRALDF